MFAIQYGQINKAITFNCNVCYSSSRQPEATWLINLNQEFDWIPSLSSLLFLLFRATDFVLSLVSCCCCNHRKTILFPSLLVLNFVSCSTGIVQTLFPLSLNVKLRLNSHNILVTIVLALSQQPHIFSMLHHWALSGSSASVPNSSPCLRPGNNELHACVVSSGDYLLDGAIFLPSNYLQYISY